MKFIFTIIISGLFICSNNVIAENTNGDICETIEKLAEATMKARQAGATKEKLLASIESTNANTKKNDLQIEIYILSKNLIEKAYEQPIYVTEKSIRYSINSFKETWYLNCVKSKG